MSVTIAATFLVPAGAVHEVTMQLLDRGGHVKVVADAVCGSEVAAATTAAAVRPCWNQARREDNVDCLVMVGSTTPKAKVVPQNLAQKRAAKVVHNETINFMMENTRNDLLNDIGGESFEVTSVQDSLSTNHVNSFSNAIVDR
jgi:hypothetical protein